MRMSLPLPYQQLGYHPAVASTFTPDDVRRLAALARLELSDQELVLFAQQLSGILTFAAEVQSVDTSSVDAAPSTAPTAALREDVVTPSLARESVLASSSGADAAGGFFTVPRVF